MRAAPARPIEGVDGGCGLGERRHGGDLAGRVGNNDAVDEAGTRPQLGSASAGLVEADGRIGAEPDLAALAVDGDPVDP